MAKLEKMVKLAKRDGSVSHLHGPDVQFSEQMFPVGFAHCGVLNFFLLMIPVYADPSLWVNYEVRTQPAVAEIN